MSCPVFVIAKQRSGTNLLRKGLASTKWFADRDEVFHQRRDLGIFWTHRALMIARDPELSIPLPEHQEAIFDSFLATYATQKAFTLIDVKYNSIHNLNSVFQNHATQPMILRLIAKKDLPVIHLVRNDSVASYVSQKIADQRQVYVETGHQSDTSLEISICPTQLMHYMKMLEMEQHRTRIWLRAKKKIRWMELEFESLLNEDGQFSEGIIKRLKFLLGIKYPLNPVVATNKLIRKPYWQLVKNFETEVVPALRKNGWGHRLPQPFQSESSQSRAAA